MTSQAVFRISPSKENVGTQSTFRRLIIAGTLVVTSVTSAVLSIVAAPPKEQYVGSARQINPSLTPAGDNNVVVLQRTDRMATPPEARIDVVASGNSNPDLPRAVARIAYLRSLEADWQGDGSSPASREALIDATSLLEKISLEIPETPLPSIGMESEGIIVMSWNSAGLVGSLSVFGDGTYSYFVRAAGRTARDGAARISDPLAARFREILLA